MNFDLAFFDFGGVLAEEGFLQGLTAIAGQTGREPVRLIQQVREVIFQTGYVYGRCDEDAFWQAVAQELKLQPNPRQWRQEILSRFRLRPWMFEVVRAVRARGLKAAILSDQVNWLDELEAAHGFFREFDAVFNSYHHGLTKSEPEFFRLALEAMGAKAERTLFVDDARSNVEVGRRMGLQSILYVDRPRFVRDLAAFLPDVAAAAAPAAEGAE